MTDRRGRSGRKAIVSDATLATEDVAVVGARVQALFAGRAERGEHLPERSTTPAPSGSTVTLEEQLDLLRAQFKAVAAETEARIDAVAVRADVAAARAARLLAASQALASELGRLSSVLPPDVAAELDEAVERFNAHLQSA
jgi:hypothetical protein